MQKSRPVTGGFLFAKRVRMALSFDPTQLAVIAEIAPLSPLPSERLSLDFIQQRLSASASVQAQPRPEVLDATTAAKPLVGRPAAVLIPLIQRQELTVLLTQRSEQLLHHAGQISFVGGSAEPNDASLIHTALREAHEEIALAPEFVEVLGVMPPSPTTSGFQVTPVVATLKPGFELLADASEVAEVFEVPLAFLMHPSHHRLSRG